MRLNKCFCSRIWSFFCVYLRVVWLNIRGVRVGIIMKEYFLIKMKKNYFILSVIVIVRDKKY